MGDFIPADGIASSLDDGEHDRLRVVDDQLTGHPGSLMSDTQKDAADKLAAAIKFLSKCFPETKVGAISEKECVPDAEEYYKVIGWEMTMGGTYHAIGGRFKIVRRGATKWMLYDKNTGREMRLESFRDAKRRAEWLLNS